jgi:hypothetical protein
MGTAKENCPFAVTVREAPAPFCRTTLPARPVAVPVTNIGELGAFVSWHPLRAAAMRQTKNAIGDVVRRFIWRRSMTVGAVE